MALTPAQRRALQLKHLARIAKAEAELRLAVAATLATLFAAYEAADTPLDESAAVTAAEEEANEAWLLLLLFLFRRRYDDAGGDLARRAAAEEAFAARVRPLLASTVATAVEQLNNGGDPQEIIDNESTLVARTMVPTSYNGGAFVGLTNSPEGGGAQKSWLSLRDTRVRPTHMEADGQTVAWNAKFLVGGHQADFPGDPSLPAFEVCNCRCVLILKSDLGPVVASGGTEMTEELPNGWSGKIAAIGRPTGDGRMLALPPGGLRTRDYPMSLTRQHVGEGTDIWVGTVDRAWIGEDGDLYGEGGFDLGGEDGQQSARQLVEGLDTVSITPDQVTFEQRFMAPGGDFVDIEDATQLDDEGYLVLREGFEVINVMTDWRLSNLSIVSIPAFDEARVAPVFGYISPREVDAADDEVFEAMLAKRKKKGKKWPSYEEYASEEALDVLGEGLQLVDGGVALHAVGQAGDHPHVARNVGQGVVDSIQRGAVGRSVPGSGSQAAQLDTQQGAVRGNDHVLLRDGAGNPLLTGALAGSVEEEAFRRGLAAGLDLGARGLGVVRANGNAGAADVVQRPIGSPVLSEGRDGVLGGAGTAVPGLAQADPHTVNSTGSATSGALVAAAAIGGQRFTKEFFDVKAVKLDGPTAFKVLPTGQVLGHIALFDSCYMMMGTNGKQGCIKPPVDADFSRFHSHAAWFGDDDTRPVGMITFGEGHRTAGSLRASQALYANIATGAAKVVVGMDEWGYFVTGEVLEQFADRAYDLLLSPLSGHWEPDMDRRGKLTMIAAHVVVTQGYDVPRVAASFSADGEIEAVQFSGPAPRIAKDVQAALRTRLTQDALRKLAAR